MSITFSVDMAPKGNHGLTNTLAHTLPFTVISTQLEEKNLNPIVWP